MTKLSRFCLLLGLFFLTAFWAIAAPTINPSGAAPLPIAFDLYRPSNGLTVVLAETSVSEDQSHILDDLALRSNKINTLDHLCTPLQEGRVHVRSTLKNRYLLDIHRLSDGIAQVKITKQSGGDDFLDETITLKLRIGRFAVGPLENSGFASNNRFYLAIIRSTSD